jgi:hypothetical protein
MTVLRLHLTLDPSAWAWVGAYIQDLPPIPGPKLVEHLFSRRWVKRTKDVEDRIARATRIGAFPRVKPDDYTIIFLSPTDRKAVRKARKRVPRSSHLFFIPHSIWSNDPLLSDIETWASGNLPTYRFTLIPRNMEHALIHNRLRRNRKPSHTPR